MRHQIVLEVEASDDPDQNDNVWADLEYLRSCADAFLCTHEFGDSVSPKGVFGQAVIESVEYEKW